MSLIVCENVSLAYDKNVVLSELSFTLNKGDYLCVVGENGSGKSTLMKALLGLIPPISGRISFGEEFSRKACAYLPQQSEIQKEFPASVYEVVLSGRLPHKKLLSFYHREDKRIVRDAMKKFDLLDLSKKAFCELSGGQQQRVLLARAVASESEVLFIDEPTTGLDPLVTAEFYRLTEELSASGKTVIMVTHDIASAVKYASHILHLHNKPLFFGKKEEYIDSNLGRSYLGKL